MFHFIYSLAVSIVFLFGALVLSLITKFFGFAVLSLPGLIGIGSFILFAYILSVHWETTRGANRRLTARFKLFLLLAWSVMAAIVVAISGVLENYGWRGGAVSFVVLFALAFIFAKVIFKKDREKQVT